MVIKEDKDEGKGEGEGESESEEEDDEPVCHFGILAKAKGKCPTK